MTIIEEEKGMLRFEAVEEEQRVHFLLAEGGIRAVDDLGVWQGSPKAMTVWVTMPLDVPMTGMMLARSKRSMEVLAGEIVRLSGMSTLGWEMGPRLVGLVLVVEIG